MTNLFLRGLLALALASALSACVSADGAVSDVTDSDRFRTICRTEPLVHAGFVVLAAEAGISASVIRAEAAAHAVVTSVCANPPASVGQALAAAADAYADVLAAQAVAAEKTG